MLKYNKPLQFPTFSTGVHLTLQGAHLILQGDHLSDIRCPSYPNIENCTKAIMFVIHEKTQEWIET